MDQSFRCNRLSTFTLNIPETLFDLVAMLDRTISILDRTISLTIHAILLISFHRPKAQEIPGIFLQKKKS